MLFSFEKSIYIPSGLLLMVAICFSLCAPNRRYRPEQFLLFFFLILNLLNGYIFTVQIGFSGVEFTLVTLRYMIVFYFLILCIQPHNQVENVIKMGVISFFLLFLFGIIFDVFVYEKIRWEGILKNANVCAFAIAQAMIFVSLKYAKSLKTYLFLSLASFACYSTGSLSGLIFLFIFWLIFLRRYPISILVALYILMLFFVFGFFSGAKFISAFYAILSLIDGGYLNYLNGSSAIWRLNLWFSYLEVANLKTFFWGNGIGSAWFTFRSGSLYSGVILSPNSHSDLLTLFYEFGFFQGFALLILLLRLIVKNNLEAVSICLLPFFLFDNFFLSALNYPFLMLLCRRQN